MASGSRSPSPLAKNVNSIPLKIVRSLSENCIEDLYDESWPIIMLQEQSRLFVWSMCAALDLVEQGVAGQACRMFEKILAKYAQDYKGDDVAWHQFKRVLARRLVLLIGTCIRLAAKMCSSNYNITSKYLRSFLFAKGWIYSLQEVVSAEFEVYQALDFYIPLWTSVELGGVLAREVGIPLCYVKSVAMVINVCEFKRNIIEQRMHTLQNTGGIRTLSLTAASVAATVMMVNRKVEAEYRIPDPTEKLAALARMHVLYLKAIINVMLAVVKPDENNNGPTTSKRMKMSN